MNKKKKHDRLTEQEKAEILNPEREARRRRIKKRKSLVITGGGILAFLIIMIFSFFLIRAIGESSLRSKASSERPELVAAPAAEPQPETEEGKEWQEGWVMHQGKVYSYKDDILTFLIMGIDKNTKAVEVAEGTDGGQADALFLLTLDQSEKEIHIIGVNRNTMTDINVYDETGNYEKTVKGQIATQHGFGNGVEKSCLYQVEAVSKLFYSLPIHGYAAVNMSAIPELNDAVGGVDVTVLEDLTRVDSSLKEGEQVHLMGKTAYWYLKSRDVAQFGSADKRLERQKQYLTAFVKKAKEAVEEDFSLVMKMYGQLAPKMVTDISADEAVYLASTALNYRMGGNNFHMIKGETVMGEKFEEFYVDEQALYELILEVFYEEVER